MCFGALIVELIERILQARLQLQTCYLMQRNHLQSVVDSCTWSAVIGVQ